MVGFSHSWAQPTVENFGVSGGLELVSCYGKSELWSAFRNGSVYVSGGSIGEGLASGVFGGGFGGKKSNSWA